MNDSRIERLTTQEEIKFRELINKILAQQSLPEVLSDSEKKELFQLLQKLELLSSELSDFSLLTNKKNNYPPTYSPKHSVLLRVFSIISSAAIFLGFVGVPGFITWIITKSTRLTIFVLMGWAVIVISFLGVGSYFGRVNWGLTMLVSTAYFITLLLVILLTIL